MSLVLSDAKSLHLLQQSLSPREQTYVDMRAQGAPAYVAAKAAGYAEPADQALVLERDPRVRSAIEYTIRAAQHKVQITRDDVLSGLMHAVHLSNTAGEMVMAWKEIGKIIGAYAPTEVIHTSGADMEKRLRKMPDRELARMAAIEGDFVELTDED